MMQCPEITEMMQLALDGRLAGGERAALDQHLARCPDCQAEFEALRLLVRGLEALPQWAPSPTFAEAVIGRVRQLQLSWLARLRRAMTLWPWPWRVAAGLGAVGMTVGSLWFTPWVVRFLVKTVPVKGAELVAATSVFIAGLYLRVSDLLGVVGRALNKTLLGKLWIIGRALGDALVSVALTPWGTRLLLVFSFLMTTSLLLALYYTVLKRRVSVHVHLL